MSEAQFLFEPQGAGTNVLQQKLGGTDGKALQLGWLLPPDKLVLDSQYPEVHVYSSAPKEQAAKLVGPLDSTAVAKIRTRFCMPCGEPPAYKDQYYEYKVEGGSAQKAERVLVSCSTVPDAQWGHKQAHRTKFLLKKAAGILGIQKGQLHKYLYFETPDGKFDYSFHAFYDPKTKALKRYGVMLEKRGVLIATDGSDFDPANYCDGCRMPTYNDPLELVLDPVNLLETSLLPCPVVLEDTSTAEGRALSLLTYDLDGVKSELRAYEYTVNCCK